MFDQTIDLLAQRRDAQEKIILQAVATDPRHRGQFLANLDESHFSDPRHRALWVMMADLEHRAPGFDLEILGNAMHDAGETFEGKTGGFVYLHNTVMQPGHWGTVAHIKNYIRTLREMAKAQRTQEIGLRLATGPVNGHLVELIDELGQPAWEEENSEDASAQGLADLASTAYAAAEELAKSGRKFAGLDCGFDPINEKLNGLCPGELTVIAARPSIGKTTLALQMALNVTQREGVSVGIISLEMTMGQIAGQLAGLLADVDPHRRRSGTLDPEERIEYYRGMSYLSRLPIWTWAEDRSLQKIRARIQANAGVRLWIVDHLHRTDGVGDNEHERLGNTTKGLGNMAIDHNVHILLLAQLNRSCEDRSDKKPQIGDLRGSGSIEEDAVNVLMIYRPGHYEELRDRLKGRPDELDALIRSTQILAEKTRFEAVGSVDLSWRPERACFADPAPAYREPAPHWSN